MSHEVLDTTVDTNWKVYIKCWLVSTYIGTI